VVAEVNPGISSFDSARRTLYKRYHMAAKTSKPRKPGRKTKGILIRVTEEQKRVLAGTAKRAGLGLSSWMLSVALLAAQQAQWEAEAHSKKLKQA
jgi:hypothetical protein